MDWTRPTGVFLPPKPKFPSGPSSQAMENSIALTELFFPRSDYPPESRSLIEVQFPMGNRVAISMFDASIQTRLRVYRDACLRTPTYRRRARHSTSIFLTLNHPRHDSARDEIERFEKMVRWESVFSSTPAEYFSASGFGGFSRAREEARAAREISRAIARYEITGTAATSGVLSDRTCNSVAHGGKRNENRFVMRRVPSEGESRPPARPL